MQEPVIGELWNNLTYYIGSVINTRVFLMDLLSAAALLLAAWIVLFLGRKLTGKLLPVPACGEEGQAGGQMNGEMAQTLRILFDTLLGYSVYILAAIGILHIFNIRILNGEDIKILTARVIQSVIILVVAKAALRIGNLLIDHWFAGDRRTFVGEKRAKTLSALLLSVLRYVVYFIAGIMILQTFGVHTASIIASAGIAGLAVGFGAQDLVKDVISGFFILFEDQFSVGEYVTVAGVTGTVEELGLRSTTIREWTGHLHTIPNGEIVTVKNFERGPILAVVTVGIGFEADIDQAIEVIKGILEKLYHQHEGILEMPVVLGVEALSESSVDLLVTAKCAMGRQWAVEREMRKQIKEGLDAAGIPIPFPTRIVYNRSQEKTVKAVDTD